MTLDADDLATLARELAMNIKPRNVVLDAFKLSAADFAKIEQIDFYKRAFEACTIEWNKPMSTPERIQRKAQALLEQTLTSIGSRMKNEKEPLTSVVEAGKFLARASGIDEGDKQALNNTEKFLIQINLGGGKVETYDNVLDKPVEELPAFLPKPSK